MPAHSTLTWTDARVEQLKTLWSEGLSASQIASRLGGVTRNAVIGKIHRLGISGRAKPDPQSATSTPPKTKPSAQPSGASRQPRHSSAPAPVPSPLPSPKSNPKTKSNNIVEMRRYLTLPELNAHTCRWPIGDPRSPDFRFCGAPTEPGQVYCSACAQKAYEQKLERPKGKAFFRHSAKRLRY